MVPIIKKEFYFRDYKTLRIKGIWLRLRIKISPVLPAFFHPSMTIYCSQYIIELNKLTSSLPQDL